MALIWTDDAEELSCDHCGRVVEELFHMESEDRGVGYREEADVCRECLKSQ